LRHCTLPCQIALMSRHIDHFAEVSPIGTSAGGEEARCV
jgi:hypothetical protein